MRDQTTPTTAPDDGRPALPTADDFGGQDEDRRDGPAAFLGGINFGMGNYGGVGAAIGGRQGIYRSTDVNLPLGKPPEDIARLQQALIAAGLLDSNKVVAAGTWGTAEQTAFRKLLTFANLNDLTWQDALSVYTDAAARGAATGSGYGSGSAEPQFQAQVTNPDDLRLALKDASAALRAGGAFDEATINRLVQVYQAQEVEDQRAAFAAEVNGAEVSTAPRSAETLLREAIREEDPSGVGAREFADRAEEFFGALGSPVTPTRL